MRERLEHFYRLYTDVIFSRKRLRIYLFAGLEGLALNRWYLNALQERLIERIVREYRHEVGLQTEKAPSPIEIEVVWGLHNGIYLYGVRKLIYNSRVFEDKNQVIAAAVTTFLEGAGAVFGVSKKKAKRR